MAQPDQDRMAAAAARAAALGAHRRRLSAGDFPQPQERGPSGRRGCRWCWGEVPKRRLTFCSDACVRELKIRTDQAYLRRQVEKRDRGVCASCSIDTGAWGRAYDAERERLITERDEAVGAAMLAHLISQAERDSRVDSLTRAYRGALDALWARREALRIPRGHLWEADHVVPVVEGGGGCGLDGIRTLCRRCHKRETAALAARRAERARAVPRATPLLDYMLGPGGGAAGETEPTDEREVTTCPSSG